VVVPGIVERLWLLAGGTLMQIVKEEGRPVSADLVEAASEILRLRQMVKDAAQALNDEERENERLRDLLRRFRDGGAKDDSPDLWREVDEMLGD